MKRDFPQGTPLEVQLLSVAAMHTPGRKHQKRKGVKASERTRANARGSAAEKHRKSALFHAQVRAYWLGQRETYPG
uniref:Uncharacterized protein n=1 Tax=Variovorax paradoxus (strain S110) TaxID=543728 RepID=C5CJR9_VARPS